MPKYIPYGAKSTKDPNKYRVTGNRKWIDHFPIGFGTRPEKIVYEALSVRGIPFQYLNDITFSDPNIEFFKTYQADFIIPSLKIIIEVQGYRWHSQPAAIESDSLKMAVYQQFGWHAIAWWDYEIEENINKLFLEEPRFAGYHVNISRGSTEFVVKRTKTDTSKGIRTLNAKKKAKYAYRKKPVIVKGLKVKGIKTVKVYGK